MSNKKRHWKFDTEGNCTLLNPDGRILAAISHETVEALVRWFKSAPILVGEIPGIKVLEVGCQSFTESEIEHFIMEFEAEEWKEPEVRFLLGSRFEWQNEEYIFASATADQVTFINSRSGSRLTDPITFSNISIRGATLKELVGASDNPNAKALMELKPIKIRKVGDS